MLPWAASIAGCGRGWTSPTDPPDGPVVYVRRGYLAPADVEATLRIADPDERLRAFAERARPVEDRFLVPPDVFEWLIKRAARARRLEGLRGP